MKNRKNIRLKHYNYSRAGYYFATICTKAGINYFGEIIEGEMELNKYGEIVNDVLNQVSNHYPNVEIDYYNAKPYPFYPGY